MYDRDSNCHWILCGKSYLYGRDGDHSRDSKYRENILQHHHLQPSHCPLQLHLRGHRNSEQNWAGQIKVSALPCLRGSSERLLGLLPEGHAHQPVHPLRHRHHHHPGQLVSLQISQADHGEKRKYRVSFSSSNIVNLNSTIRYF